MRAESVRAGKRNVTRVGFQIRVRANFLYRMIQERSQKRSIAVLGAPINGTGGLRFPRQRISGRVQVASNRTGEVPATGNVPAYCTGGGDQIANLQEISGEVKSSAATGGICRRFKMKLTGLPFPVSKIDRSRRQRDAGGIIAQMNLAQISRNTQPRAGKFSASDRGGGRRQPRR